MRGCKNQNSDTTLENRRSDRILVPFKEMIVQANSRSERKHLHRFGRRVGFCAEFNNTIGTFIKCMSDDIQFVFESGGAAKGVAVENGWEDYFTPFCRIVANPLFLINNHRFSRRLYSPIKPVARKILKSLTDCESFEFDPISRGKPKSIAIKSLEISDDFNSISSLFANALWDFNEETNSVVGSLMRKAKCRQYDVALHIRRGDKISEFSYVPIDSYVEALKPFRGIVSSVFVATDDKDTVHELGEKISSDFSVSSSVDMTDAAIDQTSSKSGYDQLSFNSLPAELRKLKTMKFLAEIEVMRNAGFFIGASTSNVFITLRSLRNGRDMLDLTENAWNDRVNWRKF